MCLHTDWTYARVARKPIKVFKALERGTRMSPYHFFYWKRGVLYRLDRSLQIWAGGMVDEGFHAYTRSFCPYDAKVALYRAIIPKGARYIRSCCGHEIVADKMKVLEKI